MSESVTSLPPEAPRPWVEVGCGKCGRHVQIEYRTEDRYVIESLRYMADPWDHSTYTRGPLGCPWCASERGGFYSLERVGARPAPRERAWEVYALGGGDLLAHVPGEAWVEFRWTPGGWNERQPCTWPRWEIEESLIHYHDVSSDPDVGESGYPPLVAAWEQQQHAEAEWDAEAAREAAERRAADPEWSGHEQGWSLHPRGSFGDATFVAVAPDGHCWEFRSMPGGWYERVPTAVLPRYLRDPLDAAAARGTGYPPAELVRHGSDTAGD